MEMIVELFLRIWEVKLREKKIKENLESAYSPRDKIDSFISAKSPTDQFKEWTDSAIPLADERQYFINTYSTLKSKKMS